MPKDGTVHQVTSNVSFFFLFVCNFFQSRTIYINHKKFERTKESTKMLSNCVLSREKFEKSLRFEQFQGSKLQNFSRPSQPWWVLIWLYMFNLLYFYLRSIFSGDDLLGGIEWLPRNNSCHLCIQWYDIIYTILLFHKYLMFNLKIYIQFFVPGNFREIFTNLTFFSRKFISWKFLSHL